VRREIGPGPSHTKAPTLSRRGLGRLRRPAERSAGPRQPLRVVVVGHEAVDAFDNHRNKPLGLIRIAAQRGFAEFSYLRQQPAFALGGV